MSKYLSEFLGTYGLVFCGTGAIIINDISQGAIGHAGIAITFGLIVLAMIYAFGDISGAHMNPAVTISFWVAKRFPAKQIIPFILSQTLGGIAASATLLYLFPIHETLGATFPAGSAMQTFWLEIVLTFFLMLVILRVSTGAKEKGITAGIAIGSVVLLEAMFAGPISGASMNPIRSFAPALVSGNFQHQWVYLIAPTIGAILAVYVSKILEKDEITA